MWANRKTRFKIVLFFVIAINLAPWLSHKFSVPMQKGFPGMVLLCDLALFFAFALLGLITSWLLAFKPEKLREAIEKSIAKQAALKNAN